MKLKLKKKALKNLSKSIKQLDSEQIKHVAGGIIPAPHTTVCTSGRGDTI